MGLARPDPLHRLRLASALRLYAPLLQVWQHEDGVYLARFSPDGRHVLTAGWDGKVQIWDVQTGRAATPPLRFTGAPRLLPSTLN